MEHDCCVFVLLGMGQGVFGQGVTDKSQVAFHKDDTGWGDKIELKFG
jgi:hypothetical protein